MLSQARGLLSPAFIFGSIKSGGDGEQIGRDQETAARKRTSAKPKPASSKNDHQRCRRPQKRSSPSGDSSSGYLSQSNASAQQARGESRPVIDRQTFYQRKPNENSSQGAGEDKNQAMPFQMMQDGRGVKSCQLKQQAAQGGPPAQFYHTAGHQRAKRPASLSSASLTMRLQPMMDDDEDDVRTECNDRRLANQDDTPPQAASPGARVHDLDRLSSRHLSYQLMIDGLKRQQRQLQQFVHRCQLPDDKLSLSATMLHNNNHQRRPASPPAGGQMIGLDGISAADECADSSDANSLLDQFHHHLKLAHHQRHHLQQGQGQRHHHHHQRHKSLDPSTSLPFGASLALNSITPRPQHLTTSCDCCQLEDHSGGLRVGKIAQRHLPAAPDYYHQLGQSTIESASEQLYSLHDHNQNTNDGTHLRHDGNNNQNRNHVLQWPGAVADPTQLYQAQRLYNKPRPPLPPPKASEQSLSGHLDQLAHEQLNSSTSAARPRPLLNSYLGGASSRHASANRDANNLNQSHILARTMMQQHTGGGSRQHLSSSPDVGRSSQQQVRRSKSSQQQLLAAEGQPYNYTNQQQAHQGGKSLARSVPKSAGMTNGPVSVAASQINANLAAIEASNERHLKGGEFPLALGCCGKLARFLLFVANLIFWSAGIALGAWGILALVDDHKYNLSQLLVFEPNSRTSLFQLLSWSFITLGCATILVGICGCSAMFKSSRWILGLYIFLILAIFALDLATGLLAIIFQERLVANVRLRLASKLRNEYGIQASFTAAIDYIQTRYECCGLDGHLDYDQSLWRLQRLGGFEATVARTCCHLRNTLDDQAHVNPRPVNESMCQSPDVRFHQSYRYRRGCIDDFERLIRHKIWTFTVGCGVVGAAILIVLALATCFCRSIPPGASAKLTAATSKKRPSSRKSTTIDNNNNRVQQQALAYASNISKKHHHHHHHATPTAHHR